MDTRQVLLASVVLLAAMSAPAAHAQVLLTQPSFGASVWNVRPCAPPWRLPRGTSSKA